MTSQMAEENKALRREVAELRRVNEILKAAATLIALFQPAEETADGTRAMVDDGLANLLPAVDVAFTQHDLACRRAGHGRETPR